MMHFPICFGKGKCIIKGNDKSHTCKAREREKTMNTILATLATVVIALGIYPTTMVVVSETEPTTGYTILQDFNGNLWEVYMEDGDWFPGDVVSCIVDGKETESIIDDEIISVRYSGYLDGWEMMLVENVEHIYE